MALGTRKRGPFSSVALHLRRQGAARPASAQTPLLQTAGSHSTITGHQLLYLQAPTPHEENFSLWSQFRFQRNLNSSPGATLQKQECPQK